METINHLREIYGGRYHKIAQVNITEPQYLQPIAKSVIADSLQTFDGDQGPKTAQLMTYGDNWRFWVIVDNNDKRPSLMKCPACGYWGFNGIECFDCGYRR